MPDEESGEEASDSTKNLGEGGDAVDWEGGAVDQQDEGEDEDLGDAIPDDHIVHHVLVLLLSHHRRPGVEKEVEEKDGDGKPEIDAVGDLMTGKILI